VENENNKIRHLLHTDEFDKYYHSLDARAATKHDEAILYLETIYVLSRKFVKRLEEAEVGMFEMRVSVGTNEYRTIIFAVDHENIIQAKNVILLNGFIKKDNREYRRQMKAAINILNNIEYGT
jgi:hypothetical protein